VGHRGDLMGAENLAYSGIRTLDSPARSESLYRLRYPGPQHSSRYFQECVVKVPLAHFIHTVFCGGRPISSEMDTFVLYSSEIQTVHKSKQ
jgi:hypothetical protein